MSKKRVKTQLLARASQKLDERILDYVVQNFNSVAYMSMDRLCYEAQCDREELLQFFHGLGVDNMLDFTSLLRQVVYADAAGADPAHTQSLREIADMFARYELANITQFSEMVDFDLVDRLAQDLLAASQVYIVGMRSSATMSICAAFTLGRVGIKTTIIDTAENYVDKVAAMEQSGFVLAFGFSRYHKGNLALLSMLKKDGFNIATITDTPVSPFVQVANYSIFLPRQSHNHTNSSVAGTMLLNTLAVYIGMQDKEGLVNHLRKYDEIRQSLDYFF